jgi:hypothetical protein
MPLDYPVLFTQTIGRKFGGRTFVFRGDAQTRPPAPQIAAPFTALCASRALPKPIPALERIAGS